MTMIGLAIKSLTQPFFILYRGTFSIPMMTAASSIGALLSMLLQMEKSNYTSTSFRGMPQPSFLLKDISRKI
jgi:hypothetical protein